MAPMWSNESVVLGQQVARVMAEMYADRGVHHTLDADEKGVYPTSDMLAVPLDFSVLQLDTPPKNPGETVPGSSLYAAFYGEELLFFAVRSRCSEGGYDPPLLFEFDHNVPARFAFGSDVSERWPGGVPVGQGSRMYIDELAQQLAEEYPARAESLQRCMEHLN